MSLPTYARFYDKNDEVIAHHAVNVGWWLDEDNFTRAVLELPWVRDAEYCVLYGITLPKHVIDKKPESTDFREWKQAIIAGVQNTLPEWNRENDDLKQAVRKLYAESTSSETPCEVCGKPTAEKCTKVPNGGWGTIKCGAPVCKECECECDQRLIY